MKITHRSQLPALDVLERLTELPEEQAFVKRGPKFNSQLRSDLPFPAGVMANRGVDATLRMFAKHGENFIDDMRANLKGGEEIPDAEARVTWGLGVAHEVWKQHGARIYDFPAPLALAFADTSFPLLGSDIPFPGAGFYIRCAGTGLRVRAYQDSPIEDGAPLDGFYVMHVGVEGVDNENLTFTVDPNVLGGAGPTGVLHVLAVGVDESGDMAENAFSDFLVHLDTNIEDTLTNQIEQAKERSGQNAADFLAWFRIVVGACAYLAQEKPDVEPRVLGPSERQRAAMKAGGKRERKDFNDARLPVSYFRAGHREVVHTHYSGTAEQRELTKRFIVRGHFRKQPIGEGRKDRKTIWIKPFFKGPEWAEIAALVIKVMP